MSSRARGTLSAALTVLACLLMPVGALAAWATYEIADRTRYEAVMAPLATDPAVREALADAVAAGILREVRVGPRLRRPVREFTYDAAHSFTRTEAFRTAWHLTNRAAHDAVLTAVREEGAYGRSGAGDGGADGEGAEGGGAGRGGAHGGGAYAGAVRPVMLDLAPIGELVKRQLVRDHVPFAHRIPVAHTEVEVLSATELVQLRKGYRVLEIAAFWLPVGALALAAGGILVATQRRRAVCATGLGAALGGALLGVAVALGRHLTLADLPPDVSPAAAGAVYDALTATLRSVTWGLLGLGTTVAAIAWLTDRLVRRRRASAMPPPAPAEEPTRVRA
ncbi:hypothetical protein F3K40_17090 [Streptomyces sp. LBUM 1478]|uniref:hypothetical protein n=1 Tax=Streptomyces scabiei TaxID=1930 RepID=UPI00055FAB7B|nr:hypothetical protein [Streptomyces scabiei]MBP5907098.1 hypothetical protein [Streptomyces sp. LBUM 1478]MBP5930064.1 hypothetical protein [Streptomyces sp. LBUM 1479]MDX2532739.1 hypothetical protein [Streptomyces scabiei]MDX2795205.1 hypothetical protein [Streptomyces scabiei]MDX2831437.1 hypothetical protein [Streptomyces scabiei]